MATSLRLDPAIRGRDATKRATELAEHQFGAVARWQLLGIGLTRSRVEHWLGTGRLHPLHRGVYTLGHRRLPVEGELAAALLFAGPGAALGGITALWWLGLLDRRPYRTHVDAPGRKASVGNILIRHPREIHRAWVRELPVVPLPEALLASTKALTDDSLRLVLARAEYRHLLDLSSVAASLGEGRSGSRAVRRALAAHLPQLAACDSQLEIEFVLLCERFGLPLPEPNPRIARWRPDMLWRERRLIVELDGRDAHSTAAQLAADARREAALRDLGFTVIRYRWEQVYRRPESVAADLRRLLTGG